MSEQSDFQAALILPRRGPTLRPMLPPWPALVAVTDTNALARRACKAVRDGRADDLFVGLGNTGRSNIYVGSHVPGELVDHLADVAASTGVDLAAADRALWDEIMSAVPVVDLAVGDYLHPRIRPLLTTDPELPAKLRGDPDDIGTAALAEFLAPAVILSADNVFMRLGLAETTATKWVEIAYTVLHTAGFEASFADAALVAELAVRAMFMAGGATFRLVQRYPIPALLILGVGVYLANRFGYLEGSRVRAGLRRLREGAEPIFDAIAQATDSHMSARTALRVVEPYMPPTVEQLAARHLARCGRALTPRELREELRMAGYKLTAAELKRAMTRHPAFIRRPGDLYSIGRPARRSSSDDAGGQSALNATQS